MWIVCQEKISSENIRFSWVCLRNRMLEWIHWIIMKKKRNFSKNLIENGHTESGNVYAQKAFCEKATISKNEFDKQCSHAEWQFIDDIWLQSETGWSSLWDCQFRPQWRSLLAVTISLFMLYLSHPVRFCPSVPFVHGFGICIALTVQFRYFEMPKHRILSSCNVAAVSSEQWLLLSIAPGVFLTSYEMILKCWRIWSVYFIMPSS